MFRPLVWVNAMRFVLDQSGSDSGLRLLVSLAGLPRPSARTV